MLSLPLNYLFLMVVFFGTIFSISSLHWLGIWVGLEVNLIGFLPILVYGKSMTESEAGTKYFIMQALGSSFLMFSSLVLFSISFSWEISVMFEFNYFWGGIIILLSGLFMKVGMFPFHFWFPGVMSGLSWVCCLLLVTWQKVAPVLLMSVVLETIKALWLVFLICVLSSGSSLVGGFGGINQSQIRGLLAYSSIGHMGWIFFALCQSLYNMKVYFLIYIIICICLFLLLWWNNIILMNSLNSLIKNSFVDLSVILLFLSLGGLPPLLGFVAKWNVFVSSLEFSMGMFIMLLIAGSVMSLFYYLSLMFIFLMNSFNKVENNGMKFWLIGVIVFINLLGGVVIVMFDFLSFI